MPPIHWASLQATLVQRFGPRIAVTDAAGPITYADLFAHAAGIGRALVEAGIRPGDMVASFLRNGRDAVAAAYATLLAGACETPLNIAYTEQERAETLAIAGCRHVVCAAEHADFFRARGCTVLIAEQIAPTPLDPAAFPAIEPSLPGRIVFTSGTTGLPKAIVYRHATRFIANLALQSSLPWLPKAGERVLLMTPFAHGASLQTFAWLDQGGEVVLLDGVRLEQVEPLLAAGRIQALFAAPTVLAKLAASFPGRSFPQGEAGLRTVFTGTAPLPPAIYAAARAMFGPAIRLTYGKSEVFNPITVLAPDETERYYAEGAADDGSCCVGWPGPGVQIAIAEDGEILIRAAHMSDGTLIDGEIRPWRADGFHATGDLGRIDAQGRLHLLARISDAMKSGGYKIYPQEIERALGPAVTVLGLPSEYWGEIVVAVAENPAPGWEEAARAAVAGLAAYKRPRFHFAVEAIPRNGQGKIVRRQLLARLLAEWRLVDGPRPRIEKRSLEKTS